MTATGAVVLLYRFTSRCCVVVPFHAFFCIFLPIASAVPPSFSPLPPRGGWTHLTTGWLNPAGMYVGVVTFSPQVSMISSVLKAAFPDVASQVRRQGGGKGEEDGEEEEEDVVGRVDHATRLLVVPATAACLKLVTVVPGISTVCCCCCCRYCVFIICMRWCGL